MLKYIVRRLLLIPVILFGVTVLIFLMLQLLGPTERSALYIQELPRNERVLEGIVKRYGLDQPIWVQYWRWLVGTRDPGTGDTVGGILRGDFGYSRMASEPVANIIRRRFPATLELALWSAIPVLAGGVILGVVAAAYHNRLPDHLSRAFAIVGWSFPTFLFGLLVLVVFYADLQWFPPGRVSDWANEVVTSEAFNGYTGLLTVDSLLNLRLDVFLDVARHLFLPIATLSYLWWAMMLRVTRSSMLEALRQGYITTARAKGLRKWVVVTRHALPNALMPVTTIGGYIVKGLLGGVVVTETIFNYPGIGSAAAEAALHLDVVAVLALTLFTGTILMLVNLAVDILYPFIDPRVRLG